MADVRKELKTFLDDLAKVEDSFKGYVQGSGVPQLSTSSLASIDLSSIKASLLKNISGNASYSEGMLLDCVFKLDACKRDLSTRKKRRSDYYEDSLLEYQNELDRLKTISTNTIQYSQGAAASQKGEGI